MVCPKLLGAHPAVLRRRVSAERLITRRYRPQFHFSPKVNWTNDPNGLVYFDGNITSSSSTTRSAITGAT